MASASDDECFIMNFLDLIRKTTGSTVVISCVSNQIRGGALGAAYGLPGNACGAVAAEVVACAPSTRDGSMSRSLCKSNRNCVGDTVHQIHVPAWLAFQFAPDCNFWSTPASLLPGRPRTYKQYPCSCTRALWPDCRLVFGQTPGRHSWPIARARVTTAQTSVPSACLK